jgi:hypothetical protein
LRGVDGAGQYKYYTAADGLHDDDAAALEAVWVGVASTSTQRGAHSGTHSVTHSGVSSPVGARAAARGLLSKGTSRGERSYPY